MTATAAMTVGDLVQLIDRAPIALTEAGHPDLAEHAHAVVRPDGRIRLSSRELGPSGYSDPAGEKFLTLDPVFKKDHLA